MSERDRIRELIRRLRERTTARGCTEAEAMEAAAKAAELMARHGLDKGDFDFEECRSSYKTRSLAELWNTIGLCTGTAIVLVSDETGDHVVFVGRDPGPEMAVYLRDVCERAIRRETATFKAGVWYRRRRSQTTKRAAVQDFTSGIVERMIGRLRLLFVSSIATGRTALVEAEAELQRRHPEIQLVRSPTRQLKFEDARRAGTVAGGRVTLAHGVGGRTDRPKLIGAGGDA